MQLISTAGTRPVLPPVTPAASLSARGDASKLTTDDAAARKAPPVRGLELNDVPPNTQVAVYVVEEKGGKQTKRKVFVARAKDGTFVWPQAPVGKMLMVHFLAADGRTPVKILIRNFGKGKAQAITAFLGKKKVKVLPNAPSGEALATEIQTWDKSHLALRMPKSVVRTTPAAAPVTPKPRELEINGVPPNVQVAVYSVEEAGGKQTKRRLFVGRAKDGTFTWPQAPVGKTLVVQFVAADGRTPVKIVIRNFGKGEAQSISAFLGDKTIKVLPNAPSGSPLATDIQTWDKTHLALRMPQTVSGTDKANPSTKPAATGEPRSAAPKTRALELNDVPASARVVVYDGDSKPGEPQRELFSGNAADGKFRWDQAPVGKTLKIVFLAADGKTEMKLVIRKFGMGKHQTITASLGGKAVQVLKNAPSGKPLANQIQTWDHSHLALRMPKEVTGTTAAVPAAAPGTPLRLELNGFPGKGGYSGKLDGQERVFVSDAGGQIKLDIKAGQDIEIEQNINGKTFRLVITDAGVVGQEKIRVTFDGKEMVLGKAIASKPLAGTVQRWFGKDTDKTNKLALRMPAEVAGQRDTPHVSSATSTPPGPAGTYQGYVDAKTGKWVQPDLPKGTDPSKVIAVLGDSISDQGYYDTLSPGTQTWASQLAGLQKDKIVWVSGRNGVSASGVQLPGWAEQYKAEGSDANTRLTTLLKSKPGTIVLELGLNDFRSGATAEQYKNAMIAMVNRIRKESRETKIVFLGVAIPTNYARPKPGSAGYAAYQKRYADFMAASKAIGAYVTNRNGDVYVENMFKGLTDRDGKLTSPFNLEGDTVHPSNAGHSVIAQTLDAALSGDESEISTLRRSGMSAAVAVSFLKAHGWGPIDFKPKSSADLYHEAMRLIAKAVTGQLTPAESARIKGTAVYAKALQLMQAAKTIATQIDFKSPNEPRQLGYELLKLLNPKLAQLVDSNPSRAVEKAWVVFNDPTLVQSMLSLARPTPIEADEVATPIKLNGQPATVGMIVEAIRSGQGLVVNGRPLSKETLADIVRSIGAYAKATGSKNGDIVFNKAAFSAAAAKGLPGAERLLAYLPLIASYKTGSAFLQALVSKANPISQSVSSTPLISAWIKKFGSDVPLQPLKAVEWLSRQLTNYPDGSITANELEQLLNTNSAIPEAQFLIGNMTFLKSLFFMKRVKDGKSILKKEDIGVWRSKFMTDANSIMNAVNTNGVKVDGNRDQWLALKLWIQIIPGLHKSESTYQGVALANVVGTSTDITFKQIKDYISSNEGFARTIGQKLGDLTQESANLDLGGPGKFRGKRDERIALKDVYEYIDSKLAPTGSMANPSTPALPTGVSLSVMEQAEVTRIQALEDLAKSEQYTLAEQQALYESLVRTKDEKGNTKPPLDIFAQSDEKSLKKNIAMFAGLLLSAYRAQALAKYGKQQYGWDEPDHPGDSLMWVLPNLENSVSYAKFVSMPYLEAIQRRTAGNPALYASMKEQALKMSSAQTIDQAAGSSQSGSFTDFAKVNETLTPQFIASISGLSDADRKQAIANYVKNMQKKFTAQMMPAAADAIIDAAAKNPKAAIDIAKVVFKDMGLIWPTTWQESSQATLGQRIVRIVATSIRAFNTSADELDSKIGTNIIKALNASLQERPPGAAPSLMAYLGTEHRANLMAQWQRAYGVPAPTGDLNEAQVLQMARIMYGEGGDGATKGRQALMPFKEGKMHMVSFCIGIGLTIWAYDKDGPQNLGERLKFASSIIVATAGAFTGGVKYEYNFHVRDRAINSVSEFLNRQHTLTDGRGLASRDLLESNLRMLSGLAYIAYGIGAGLNINKLQGDALKWGIADITVNLVAGFLPFVEGFAQLGRYQVNKLKAVPIPTGPAVPAGGATAQAPRWAQVVAKLYGGNWKLFWTYGNIVLTVAQIALLVGPLISLKKQSDHQKKMKREFSREFADAMKPFAKGNSGLWSLHGELAYKP